MADYEPLTLANKGSRHISDEVETRLKEAVDAAEAKCEGRSDFDRNAIADEMDACGKLLAAI